MLDRMDVRRKVGELVIARNKAQAEQHAVNREKRDAIWKKWRDALEVANGLRRQLDEFDNAVDKVVSPMQAEIDALVEEYDDIKVMGEGGPSETTPVVCDVTGLGIFDDDEIYGSGDYGPAILAAAVTVNVEPLPGHGGHEDE
jgi:hypothetical protein